MQTIKLLLRNSAMAIIILVQTTLYPLAVFAEGETPPVVDPTASTTETVVPPTEIPPPPPPENLTQQQETTTSAAVVETQGPTSPPGPAPYVLNPETGMWENDRYAWDPVTKQTKPLTAVDYSYNPATGMWDTTEWVFHPESGTYEPQVVSVASISNTGPGSTNEINGLGAGAGLGINNTGPGSDNSINLGGNLNGTFDLFFNAAISTTLNSTATSGNALVQGNTLGGSALTGDAQVVANILNMLQSSWFGQSPNVANFVANVDGNVFGDLTFNPDLLPYRLGTPANSDIDVNISNNGLINNDINLAATSGNATVEGNTTGGNATTGDASAIANIINMMNSAISANRSFIGMLNINGNLNGDILLPPSVLDALIASTGPDSTNTINGSRENNLEVNVDRTRTISNNIQSDATSGDAQVTGNTTGGNATSGSAETSVNQMNLVGQNLTGSHGLLVFVNVLGSWVGMLFSSPGGSSAIATTGPDSTNSINADGSTNVEVNLTENSRINNNLNLAATSGDATVAHNTRGGNATSGDASTAVNLLNMIDSQVRMTDWFGVLFINVFGHWDGSFGVDTPSGDTPEGEGAASGEGVEVFEFAATDEESAADEEGILSSSRDEGEGSDEAVIASAASVGPAGVSTQAAPGPATGDNSPVLSPTSSNSLVWAIAGASALAIAAFIFLNNRYLLMERIRVMIFF